MVEETGDEKETDEDEETDHDEETDDHEEFPIEIQIKFLGFIVDELFPAVLKFMSKHYSRLFGCPIQEVGFRQLCYSLEPVELSFNRKQQYDLFNLRSVMILPACGLSKMYGKDWVGAALRICGYIGQAKLADDLRTIIGDCFTPDEESVREDFLKDAFFAFKCPSEKVANSADLIAGNCLNTEKQDGKADNKDNQERYFQCSLRSTQIY